MASLGRRLLESSITCSSEESTKDKLEILDAGNTFWYIHMILIFTVVISVRANVHLEYDKNPKDNTVSLKETY